MKIKELIEKLQELDPEMPVFIVDQDNFWSYIQPLKEINCEIMVYGCLLSGFQDKDEK